MANMDLTKPGIDGTVDAPAEVTEVGETRRAFFNRAIAAASSAALASLLPSGTAEAAPPCHATTGEELITVGTLQRTPAGVLDGLVRMTQENRAIPLSKDVCDEGPVLKVFEGYNGNKVDPKEKVWPKDPGRPAPGPTLRARVGDTVKLTFLDEVDASKFSGTFGGNSEFKTACDSSVNAKIQPNDNNWLPKDDTAPNCFHGSNIANLHFHGTHVTPSGFGDNVLLQVVPYPDKNPSLRIAEFNKIFNGNPLAPANFKTSMPIGWQNEMKTRLTAFDKINLLTGERSTELQNQKSIAKNEWPAYQAGAFPNFFYITKSTPAHQFEMDQAPGTHWYHAHKHGSTALDLLNGLAGAFIIEGQYDDDLRKWNAKVVDNQKVLVIQEFGDVPNLYRAGLAGGAPRTLLVNGQYQPAISMNQGSVVWLRIINASQQSGITIDFTNSPFLVRQIAQDGVQFQVTNYDRFKNVKQFVMAPANRIDLLVQAPKSKATFNLTGTGGNTGAATLITLKTTDISEPMAFPTDAQFPAFPLFLRDITASEIRKYRRLTFGWEKGRTTTQRTGPNNAPPHYMIDGKQFGEHYYDQTMELGAAEEWLIEYGTTVAHPFHIHVNPFQVVETMDPNTVENGSPVIPPSKYGIFQNPTPGNHAERTALIAKCTKRDPTPWIVWWDNRAIPGALAQKQASGPSQVVLKPDQTPALMGYFKMWTRFVDFTGSFVLHCHILGHEDRGMMQLVQVVPKPTTTIPHH